MAATVSTMNNNRQTDKQTDGKTTDQARSQEFIKEVCYIWREGTAVTRPGYRPASDHYDNSSVSLVEQKREEKTPGTKYICCHTEENQPSLNKLRQVMHAPSR